MSKYTTELRYIVESEKNYPRGEGVKTLSSILQNYPLYNSDKINELNNKSRRNELNDKIIAHFYFREIGFETVDRFLFNLEKKLNEIMVLYNQRYESIDFDFNPLWNVDMSETYEHTVTGNGKTTSSSNDVGNSNSSSNGTSNGDNLVVDSDTPNQQLSEDDIKSNTWASKTSYDKNSNSSNNTSSVDTTNNSNGEINTNDTRTESFTRREYGSSKGYTFAQNIEQWRNIMLNVDMDIIKELESLFMNLW